MKALTLWQPWAALIATGDKHYETRSWKTDYRGVLAIHAAKKFDVEIMNYCTMTPFTQLLAVAGYGALSDLKAEAGHVLCVVELIDCYKIKDELTTMSLPGMTFEQLKLGDYAIGRYAWQLQLIEIFDAPIPATGKQSLWDWENE